MIWFDLLYFVLMAVANPLGGISRRSTSGLIGLIQPIKVRRQTTLIRSAHSFQLDQYDYLFVCYDYELIFDIEKEQNKMILYVKP